MSCQESIGAKVKVTLTGPDGKVLKVIEDENPDPFDRQFLMLTFEGFFGQVGAISIQDIFYNTLWVYVSPTSTFLGFGALSMPPCLIGCGGLPNSPPNGPGLLFFSDDLSSSYSCRVSVVNCSSPVTSGIAYSPLKVSPSFVEDAFGPNPGMASFTVSQSATNVSGSPITVTVVSLIAAIAGTANPSPALIPVSLFALSPPLVWSPGVTITVSVTYIFPYGIPVSSSSPGSITAV